jgi:uncharacterized lipoprotein YmbA
MTMRPPLLAAAAALALAACAGSPDYFLLPPPQPVARQAAPAGSLAVAEISLPAYAEAMEIAVLTGAETATADRQALWADTPRRALTRHLVAALDARLAARVVAEPWPGYDQPALRVEVIADRMIGTPGGGVEFTGQFIIVAPESGRIVSADRFAITTPAPGEGNPGLLAAHARAIEALADRIAARVTGRAPAS